MYAAVVVCITFAKENGKQGEPRNVKPTVEKIDLSTVDHKPKFTLCDPKIDFARNYDRIYFSPSLWCPLFLGWKALDAFAQQGRRCWSSGHLALI